MRHSSMLAVLLTLALGCRATAPRPPPAPPKTEVPKAEAPKPSQPAQPTPAPPAPPPPPKRLSAVRPYTPPAPAPSDAAVLARFAPLRERVTFFLYDPRTKQVVAEQGADALQAPASTAKVFSALAALDVLGPARTFPTTLMRTGRVRAGVLEGDLYLRGSGDPQLNYARLAALAQALRTAGVTRVKGRFLYDDAFLAAPASIDPEQPEDASYSPGLSALSVDSNRVSLRWQPTGDAPGEVEAFMVPSFNTSPPGLYAGPDDGVGVHRAQADEGWLLSADLPASGERRLPLRQPGAWAAAALRRFAQQAGVTLPEPVAGLVPRRAQPLAAQRGPPVMELAEATLLPSNNAMAELLLLATARELTGKAVGLQDAGEALGAWWRARVPQGKWEGLSLLNGSGLTAKSRASARQLVLALDYARGRAKEHGRPFFTLLPAAGWSGTLAGRLHAPETALNVWAKTGSMDYASGVAGHLFTRSGRELLFCILVSDLPQREALRARPAASLAEQEKLEGPANAWLAQARRLQDALLTRWALVH